MRVALVGPAHPFRGGIAHHTNLLAAALGRRGHQVDVVTFSRQYPRFLYPGKFQEEPAATSSEGVRSAERMIDSINPVNWWRSGQTLAGRGYDLVVFKFWHPFFSPAFGTVARCLRGKTIIMAICENVLPHERHLGDRALVRFFLRGCDLAVTQCGAVEAELRRLMPALPQAMLPHPTYSQFGPRVDKSAARAQLGITARQVILFFGFVREYKGLDRLLAAMPLIVKQLPGLHLYVVGEFFRDFRVCARAVEQAGLGGHVTLVDRYVTNDEVRYWFSAADFVLLPYRSATGSGIVQVAHHFALPAVVTDVGSLREVVIDGRTGLVLPDGEPTTIATAVVQMYADGRLKTFSEAIESLADKYSWEAYSIGIETLVQGYAPPPRARPAVSAVRI
jgi:glycosyltransferase involved in cell wall biosynthesis